MNSQNFKGQFIRRPFFQCQQCGRNLECFVSKCESAVAIIKLSVFFYHDERTILQTHQLTLWHHILGKPKFLRRSVSIVFLLPNIWWSNFLPSRTRCRRTSSPENVLTDPSSFRGNRTCYLKNKQIGTRSRNKSFQYKQTILSYMDAITVKNGRVDF